MLLCDIGNSSYHFLDTQNEYKENVKSFNPQSITQKVYYISVNSAINEKLKSFPNWINLQEYISRDKYYESMGIDRIVVCETVTNGVIVDAGSAITVDIMRDGIFEGGFIYPGRAAMQKTYENISDALAYSFNFELNLDKMPKNSQDAISYGYLKTLFCEVNSYGMDIILTGGDALEFKKIFKDAQVKQRLIFDGMKKIIQKADIC